jgi:serine/threonine-protein kinase
MSCPSLRQATSDGNPIYAVYRFAGSSKAQVCAAVRAAGENAYGKWLDTTSDPNQGISCDAQPAPTRAPLPSAPQGDLGLSIPMSRPACDGTGIVILDSVTTPGRFKEGVAAALARFPGASYLRTDMSCPSLRQVSDEGNPIYAVYRVAGQTTDQLCRAVAAAGGNAYGRWLDYDTDPSETIQC